MAHQAGAYPSFSSMKRLGVFLLPPGWDASPSHGYPPALNSPVLIYIPGLRIINHLAPPFLACDGACARKPT